MLKRIRSLIEFWHKIWVPVFREPPAPDVNRYGREKARVLPFVRKIVAKTENYKGTGWEHVTLECGHWAVNLPGHYGDSMVCQECILEAEKVKL